MSDPSSEQAVDDAPQEEDLFRESVGLIGVGVFVMALLLLALTPFATASQPAGKAWFLSPRNMPLIGIALMLVSGGILGLRFFRDRAAARNSDLFRERAFGGFEGFGLALQYSILFCVYVYALTYIGFAVSTWLFGQVCLWRAGLRSWRWAGWNLLFAVVVVVVLRVLMGLWFPQAPVLQYAPAWFANTVGPYL